VLKRAKARVIKDMAVIKATVTAVRTVAAKPITAVVLLVTKLPTKAVAARVG
jgi:hypothetical protein